MTTRFRLFRKHLHRNMTGRLVCYSVVRYSSDTEGGRAGSHRERWGPAHQAWCHQALNVMEAPMSWKRECLHRWESEDTRLWCGVVWCGVVWCGVVWCGVVWCGMVWCGEGEWTPMSG